MIKNKLVAVLGVPAGAVWLIDNFVTNMPHVLEGGVFAAGVGATLLGAQGVRKLLHAVTADRPAEQADQAPSVAQEGEEPRGAIETPEVIEAAMRRGREIALAQVEARLLASAPTSDERLRAFVTESNVKRLER